MPSPKFTHVTVDVTADPGPVFCWSKIAAALRSMAGLFGHAKVLETIQLAGPALVKEVISKGKGAETPPPGAEVSAHYVGKLPSGADFDSRCVTGELAWRHRACLSFTRLAHHQPPHALALALCHGPAASGAAPSSSPSARAALSRGGMWALRR